MNPSYLIAGSLIGLAVAYAATCFTVMKGNRPAMIYMTYVTTGVSVILGVTAAIIGVTL